MKDTGRIGKAWLGGCLTCRMGGWILATASLSCAFKAEKAPKNLTVYAPHEAGLTLIYEDMTLPSKDRMEARYQARVMSSKDGTVHCLYSSLKGERHVYLKIKNGGVTLFPLNPDVQGPPASGKMPGVQLIPEGFPYTVSQWESGGGRFRFLGRAAAALPGVTLPEDAGVGLWVEMESAGGQRSRSLFLPNIGEAQTMYYRNGQWVTASRLVSRGFTDVPDKS